MAARLRRGIAWYDGHLKAAPIRTKIATSVSILSVADVIRQGLEWRNRPASAAPSTAASPPPAPGAATPRQQPRELPAEAQEPWEWDSARTGRMSLWGCTGHPLVIHYWMNMMERWHGSLPITAPKAQIIKLAARKVTVDQLTASPVFLGAFLCWTTMLEGKGIEGCREKIANDWFTMVKFGWSTWFVGHFISFAVVPVHWRVLYINIVSIGFGTILSQVANLPPPGASASREVDPEGKKLPKPQVVTPVDMLYRQFAGPDAYFWSAEGATAAIGASWLAATASIVYHRAAIGPLGLACSAVGLSVYAFEAAAVMMPPDS